MKILETFDTKSDAQEMSEAILKYGEWNVILVKRHRIRLMLPLFLIVLAFLVCNLLVYIIYYQFFDEKNFVFRLIAFVYLYTTISWCVHSCVWIFKNIAWQNSLKKKYIENINSVLKKQKSFERFLRHTFVTFGIHTLLMISNAIIPFIVFENTKMWSVLVAIVILFVDFVFLFILNKVVYKIIDYEMNFDICTSDSFTEYKQVWFFHTSSTNIATSAIKVVEASKKWILWAFLQYWFLSIHTYWDDVSWWKAIELSYIPQPQKLAKRLNNIVEQKSWLANW